MKSISMTVMKTFVKMVQLAMMKLTVSDVNVLLGLRENTVRGTLMSV